MRNNLPCAGCGQVTPEINAQVYSGARTLTAQLCVSCFALPEARAAFVARLRAGDFGSDARVIWYHELPAGGVQVLRGKRSGSGLALFVADQAAKITEQTA
jgi:hypothetical protein